MDIGIALPTMARGYTRQTTLDWCRLVDQGPYPFSSISCGERITFHNQEMLVTNSAAAALTERVQVFVNVAVAPLHATAVLAKQLATLDVLCDGRLTVAVGIGGRGHDFRAAEASMERRHQRMDDQVAELRRLWAGEAPFPGGDPVGPPPVQAGGPPILAAALGPKAMARAAQWADGVSGFSVAGSVAEMAGNFALAEQSWTAAGRSTAPRKVNGCFYALGADDAVAAEVLRSFAHEYLAIFGENFAAAMAAECVVSSADALRSVVDGAAAAGCDELILVPATVDLDCLERTITALSA